MRQTKGTNRKTKDDKQYKIKQLTTRPRSIINEQKTNKLAPSFDLQPYTVGTKKYSRVSVSSSSGTDNCTIRNIFYSYEQRITNIFTLGSIVPEISEGADIVLERKCRTLEQTSKSNESVPYSDLGSLQNATPKTASGTLSNFHNLK